MSTTKQLSELRLNELAQVIRKDWKKVNLGAEPYLNAMRQLYTVNDQYGCDSAKSIVLYFLSNASSWRGETAKAVKGELNRRIKS